MKNLKKYLDFWILNFFIKVDIKLDDLLGRSILINHNEKKF